MRMRRSLFAAVALAASLTGCTRYFILGSGDAACLEVIREGDFRAPRGYADWLRFWQSTDYCRRVREAFASSFQASLPNFGVLRPQQNFVVGNTVTFEVGVRNEGATRSPDFNVLIQAWAGSAPPAPPSFTVTQRFTALDPGTDSRRTVDVTVPAQRPVDVLLRVTADPPTATSAGGEVWESDENNNVRERMFTIF